LIIVRLRLYHTRFDSLMQASNTTKSRFLRLLLLSMTLVFVLFPIQVYISFENWPRHPHPFKWSEIHDYAAWANIFAVSSGGMVSRDRWVQIVCGFLIFVFFGMGREAMAMYKSWAKAVGLDKVFGRLQKKKTVNTAQADSQASFLSKARGRILSSFLHKDPEKTE